jgi:hypothetical protein
VHKLNAEWKRIVLGGFAVVNLIVPQLPGGQYSLQIYIQ